MPLKRIIWFDVEGLPLKACCKDVFQKILSRWCTIVHIDDDLREYIYKNRVCVLTTCQDIIYDVVKVCVDDSFFSV